MFTFNNRDIFNTFLKNKLKDDKFLDIPYVKLGQNVMYGERYRIGDAIVMVVQAGAEEIEKASIGPFKVDNLDYWTESEFTKVINTQTGIWTGEYRDISETPKRFKLLKKIWDLSYEQDYKYHVSNSSYWDWLTHFYLGKYLSYLKAYKGLDLLSMYNVWSGQYISDYILSANYQNGEWQIAAARNKKGSAFDILKIDIETNQDYSIFIDSSTPVLMYVTAYDKGRLLSKQPLITKYYPSMQFRNPQLLNVSLANSNFSYLQSKILILKDYVTLMIQVPKTVTRKLVLKGNYTNKEFIVNNITNALEPKDRFRTDITRPFSERNGTTNLPVISNSSVIVNHENIKTTVGYEDEKGLFTPSGTVINGFNEIPVEDLIKTAPDLSKFLYQDAISTGLIQYLMDFAITDSPYNEDNVVELKEKLSYLSSRNRSGTQFNYKVDSDYSDIFRKYIYELGRKLKHTELTGYVDKDIEDFIDRAVGE